MSDFGVHLVLNPGFIEQVARRPQRLFALLASVVVNVGACDELADIAVHCELHIEQVHQGPLAIGAGQNQIANRLQ